MRQAERLESLLGDPTSSTSAVSFGDVLLYDEREQYPEPLHAKVAELGFTDYFVPKRFGGKLASFEEFCALFRVIARRDPALALGHGISWVGSLPIFVCGNDDQKHRAAQLLAKRARLAFLLTERAHGSDLQASETRAVESGDGYALSGEKWLINNGTLSDAFSIVVNTGERELSVFFVEKAKLPPESWFTLPKVRTLGVRALDISGLHLENATVPGAALVGERWAGFEVILKSLQLSRALSAPLCLGPLDTCLRATLDFALCRILYNRAVSAIAHARRALTDAFVDALLLDCLGLMMARAVHAAPEQLSVWSSVQKYFVPTRSQATIERLSVILGARYYLRDNHWSGIFQKMMRDNALVALFDGSTVVNLSLLAAQLPLLARRRVTSAGAGVPPSLRTLLDVTCELPEFDPSRLRLASESDDLIDGFAAHAARVSTCGASDEVRSALEAVLQPLVEAQRELDRALLEGENEPRATAEADPERFDLAERHCFLHAAAVALAVWLENRDRLDVFFAEGHWLVLALTQLAGELGVPVPRPPQRFRDHVWRQLLRLHGEGRQFSLIPLRLGRRRIPASPDTELSRAAEQAEHLSESELDALASRLSLPV